MKRKPEHVETSSVPELEDLLEDLLAENLEWDPELQRMFDSLKRRTGQLPPTVRANVMERVRAISASPWRRGWSWATAPRTLHVRPLTTALAAAALIAGVMLTWPERPLERAQDSQVAGAEAITRFVLVAPGASRVAVTGDFVNWDPAGVPLTSQGKNGVWVTELRLSPGLYRYVFVIDGAEWRPDPNATSQVDDGFGQRNSLLLVPSHRS